MVGRVLVVPSEEDTATDSDGVAIVVTDVLVGISEYDETVCEKVVIGREPV